jgi:hypothetical protein
MESGAGDSERRSDERIREERIRRYLIYGVLGALALLVGLSLYGTFVTGPNDRDEIRDLAGKAETTSDALAKSNAGLTALMCTGANRHDSIDTSLITVLLAEEERDVGGGENFTTRLEKTLKKIPPATNCGELICQFFREIDEPGAEIVIKDPFGPDRPEEPCGVAPEAEAASAP